MARQQLEGSWGAGPNNQGQSLRWQLWHADLKLQLCAADSALTGRLHGKLRLAHFGRFVKLYDRCNGLAVRGNHAFGHAFGSKIL